MIDDNDKAWILTQPAWVTTNGRAILDKIEQMERDANEHHAVLWRRWQDELHTRQRLENQLANEKRESDRLAHHLNQASLRLVELEAIESIRIRLIQ